MSKVRVYELAKRLRKSSKEVLDELSRIGIQAKTHTSSIDEETAGKVIKALSPVKGAKPAPAGKKEEPKAAKPQQAEATKPNATEVRMVLFWWRDMCFWMYEVGIK